MKKEQNQKKRTPTKMLFLRRMERLIEIKKQSAWLSHSPSLDKLVSKAIYSTLLDCRDLGVEDEVRRILESCNLESPNTSR